MGARVTLTSKQLQEASAIELLDICLSMVEDGKISEDEVLALDKWLAHNKESNIPAIQFLVTICQDILQDGQISPKEYYELSKAIQRIIPKEEREKATTSVTTAESDLDRHYKEEEIRNTPCHRILFTVAGVTFEKRQENIAKIPYDDYHSPLTLLREPKNKYDKNAIKIISDKYGELGFIPRAEAKKIAPLLDSGRNYLTYISYITSYSKADILVDIKDMSVDASGISTTQVPKVVVEIYKDQATLANLKKIDVVNKNNSLLRTSQKSNSIVTTTIEKVGQALSSSLVALISTFLFFIGIIFCVEHFISGLILVLSNLAILGAVSRTEYRMQLGNPSNKILLLAIALSIVAASVVGILIS